jgi:hypothetical protein
MDDVLIEACKSGDVYTVSRALREGADLHCYGDTPLFHAAIRGHYAVVQHLWIHAPAPRIFHVGQGTLRKVAEKGFDEIVNFLAPFATPSEIETARVSAERRGQTTTVLVLERFQTPKNVHTVCISSGSEEDGEN